MQLKTLILQGFKSFVDKTEISFEDGITAVVGPNGSGKSNISDALRWVLGEQSAKTLRGSKMGDVVFSGTEKRNPVGFCKVTLIFENNDRWLNIDHSEVEITRKYYRSGESEYYINKSQCRLKDVLELFRDTGVGKEGYSIIGQGQITNILSNNAGDRRMAFEAATGILKYKSRKAEAQSRLLKTGENIDRLNDVLDEISLNLENLEIQSAEAKEYLTGKEQLKNYELAKFIFKNTQSEEKSRKLNEELAEIDKVLLENDGTIQECKKQKDALALQLREATENQQALNEKYLALREEILKSGSKGEITVEKIKSLNENIALIEKQDGEIEADLVSAKEQIATDRESLEKAKAELESRQAELDAKTKDHDRLKEKLNSSQNELEDLKQQKILFLNSVSEIKINASKYNTMLEAINKRLEDISVLRKQINLTIDEFNEKKASISAFVQKLNNDKSKLDENKQQFLKEEQEVLEDKNNYISFIHSSDVEISSIKSKLGLLKSMQKDYEGYNFAVKNLFKAGNSNPAVKNKIKGTVADIIDVKKEYIVAIETALGGALQNIVTDTEEDAKFLINILKNNNLGRATFLPVSSVRPAYLNSEENKSLQSFSGVVGCGVDLVAFAPKFTPVMEKLLGRTVVVDNIDTAIQVMRKNSFRFQTVTLDGEIIHAGGAMSGGSRNKKSTGLLGRGDEIATLEKELEKTLDKAKGSEEKILAFDKNLLKIKTAFNENKEKLKHLYDEIDKSQNEISIIDAQIANETEKLVAVNEETEQLNDNSLDINEKLKLVSDDNKTGSMSFDEEKIEKLAAFVCSLREDNDNAYQELSELSANIGGLEKDISVLERDINRAESTVENKSVQLDKDNSTIVAMKKELEVLSDDVDSTAKLSEENEQRENALKEELKKAEESLEMLRIKQSENDKTIEACEETIKAQTERRYKIDIELNKTEVELKLLDEDMFERYDLSLEDVMKLELPYKPAVYKNEIDALREKIKGMVNVNLNAIDEYAFTRSRHEQISSQIDDLTASKTDLEELIDVLQKDMTERFKEQFKLINANFERIFKSLFGGGNAQLLLDRNESVLESDIEIVAQPPGKKLQNISLMSGGEKALTAIAILFAMLELKPTPFCVLDEIESALDEANVHGFASYLKNYSEKTQFLVITHRRGVMEMSDAIYGVAMQEKGVSKVVSINMSDKKTK